MIEMTEPIQENATVIRTPDQRLRVFISSTLRELAAEREAVRQAVTRLRLTPVLFETAARPHDARDLYRAYLAQSHIFIGIYWERYGWVGPGMEISGLEDEYRRAQEMPRLVYMKKPAPEREPGLKALAAAIKNDGVSYKYFATAEELRELVENDLALLLTERFEQVGHRPDPAGGGTFRPALPHFPTQLIGREREVAAVQELIAQPKVRLVTLTGPGGVGKTRLAAEVARALAEPFEQQVFWVPLADIRKPELVLSALAAALDVRERAGVPLLQSLKQYLREKRLLLLLDNFEQVIAAGPLLSELIVAAPGVKMLVTSRSPLHLRGEYEVPVSPLEVPDPEADSTLAQQREKAAVRLFVERAQAAWPDFTLSEAIAPDVAAIVRRLDGLPLAIELAAARIKLLPPAAILARLDPRLRLLTGTHDLPPRQQTLENTIEWSYNLLDRDAQILFDRLGVFVGGFTLEAAEAVCNPHGELDVLRAMETLVDNSLVRAEPARQADQERRLGMLQTIHEFALERLLQSDEAQALRRQHAHFFARVADEAGRRIYSGESEAWLDRLQSDYNNFRNTIDWFQSSRQEMETGWQLMIDINWLWYRRGYLNEARQWYERAIGQAYPVDEDPLRANIMLHAGIVAMWQSDLPMAARLMDSALPILRNHGKPSQMAVALFGRGVLAVNQGDTETARETLAAVVALLQQAPQPWFQAMTLLHLGNVALSEDDVTTARAYMDQVISLGMQIDDRWIIASAANNLGEIARYLDDYEGAEQHYLRSKALFQEVGSAPDIARANHSLGYVALSRGDYRAAATLFRKSLSLHQQLGVRRGVVEALTGLAVLRAAQSSDDEEAAAEAFRLLAAAEANFAALEAGMWPADRVEMERAMGRAGAGLAEAEIAAAVEMGRSLSPEEAVGLALRARGDSGWGE